MSRGVVLSGLLHGVILAMAILTFRFVEPLSLEEGYIPVELLPVSDVTDVRPETPSETPTPEPKPAPAEPEQLAALPPEKPPEPVEVAPDPLAPEAPAEPPPPEPRPREEITPQAEEAPPKTPRPKPPRRQPKPEAPKPPKQDFDIDQILGVIDQEQKQPRPEQQASETPSGAERPQRGAGLQTGLTVSEKDAILGQMRRCWNPPVGAPRPEELIVRLFIRLRQDGTLDGPPDVVDAGRYSSGDTYYRAAVEAARRAVIQCQPYSLPSDKFEAWREIDMIFDPTRMAGLR